MDVYPKKIVHPSMQGGAGGGLLPLAWVPEGGIPTPLLGGLGSSDPSTRVMGAVPLKLKIDVKCPYKSIVISSQNGPFSRKIM